MKKASRFGICLAAHPDFVVPLDYAFGSGKNGITYVSVVEGGQVAEIRMSYFPRLKAWHTTPGDEHLPKESLARMRPPEDAHTCFSCHAVMPSAQTIAPKPQYFGVGCESCHGAGSTHVQLMCAHRYTEDKMADLSTGSGTKILTLCGQCHGSPQAAMASANPVSVNDTNRFQPFGLAQSRCFKGSKGALTCNTCHDPHTNVSTDQKGYEAICLSCHTPAAAHRPPLLRSAVVRVCPVNPTNDCVRCHMPADDVISSTSQTRMADHFIRVFPVHRR